MKKIIAVLVAFFSVTFCFSQTTISLKRIPFEIKNQNFYIENVVDKRQDKLLGEIEDNSGKKETLSFLGGTEVTIKKFMDIILPAASDKTPIHISINNLKINILTEVSGQNIFPSKNLHLHSSFSGM